MMIKHKLIYKGKDGDILLMEQHVDWKISEQELKDEPINQLGIMDWEDENILKKYLRIEREIIKK